MLKKIGILSANEENQLIEELQKIAQEHKERKFTISIEDEDCHTAIENRLIKSLGDSGSKIHTGRSRNDQVLVALRLYYKSSLSEISSMINQCIEHLQKFGDNNNFDLYHLDDISESNNLKEKEEIIYNDLLKEWKKYSLSKKIIFPTPYKDDLN